MPIQNGSYDEYLASLAAQAPRPQTPTGAALGMRQQLFPQAPAPAPAPKPRADAGVDPTPTGTIAAAAGGQPKSYQDLQVAQQPPQLMAPGTGAAFGGLFGSNDAAPEGAVPMPAGAADILATLPKIAPAATPSPADGPVGGPGAGAVASPLAAAPVASPAAAAAPAVALPAGTPTLVGDSKTHTLDQAVAMNQHLTPRAIMALMQMAPPVLSEHDKIMRDLNAQHLQTHNDTVAQAKGVYDAAISPVDANGQPRTVSAAQQKAALDAFTLVRQNALKTMIDARSALISNPYATAASIGAIPAAR